MRKTLFNKSNLLLLLALCSTLSGVSAQQKVRLVVLTDIGGDPDDQMSMVRLMTYANHVDIEGLIATPQGGDFRVEPQYIERSVAAYGRSQEHTSELQSREDLVCRLLLEKKKTYYELVTS